MRRPYNDVISMDSRCSVAFELARGWKIRGNRVLIICAGVII